MSFDECTSKHTERQLKVWLAWLDLQWNRPDRHDHYLMQLDASVKRSTYGVKAKGIKMEHSLLKFKRKKGTSIEDMSESERKAKIIRDTAVSKTRWAAVFGQAGVPMSKIKMTPPTEPAVLQEAEDNDGQ